ncbi:MULTISPECIES: tRNA (adenosine(37)-N6)-dimethylallyltransferase MiaA [Mesonia]|uniref:tRNA dimethylallyltransferase n=1 Tax=Mesonia oceanica TaxID=2687242 RepID=A0AC61YBD6_9FLAO|nr:MULTISPECIES: tRNA (adenosine(37)-N6)-dimethylallyltransferase MiaA [Mesonia]MAN29127.1 tRNA (adenosine(37)-N6)-dimethylallyltransferase MiaA [Mesonia sp.]MAQ41851.1 tRNA (adenosine(37)-N6)-dimethylallyltransferase MiaA [Mesonia sp.]MBJ98360.1 tRNA (adenosine(37)-N6)-dimethylallyltransferase MiaA [Flavobacteriaceae bacterium]VVV01796.1 tRNA dimethylallyltransferase [Mesonia oceanica]
MKNKSLISVVGPTAIGKTSIGIALAQHYQTEIISADSRQFFKEMEIGTAVPSKEELAAAKHHFIQHISVEDNYSVGDFETEAIEKLNALFQQHDKILMVGGSGLYVKAVLEGLDYFPKIDASIRQQLNLQLEEKGIESLQQQLKELDPVYAKKVDLENPHRVIRALEICIGSGKPYSGFLNNNSAERNFNSIKIGLTAPRELIYERIEKRVDVMMEQGLLEEAKRVYEKREFNALNTVGYKELFQFFDGNWSLEFAISEIKKNTRRFAKRQLTWFRKDKEIEWFNYNTAIEQVIDFIDFKTSPR